MIKKCCLFVILSLMTHLTYTIEIEQEIELLRKEQAQKQKNKKILEELAEKKKIRSAFIADFKEQQQCAQLGLNCETGEPEGVDLDVTLKKISDEQKLIDARLQLEKKREDCKKEGINCLTGETIVEQGASKTFSKLVQKKVIAKPPILIGFINQYVLFEVNNKLKKFQINDELINGYVLHSVIDNTSVLLSHPDVDEFITVFVEK